MSQLKRAGRVYGHDPAACHRSMASGLSARMLAGRREKVGEMVRGRLLDIGFGSGLSLPHYPPDVQVFAVAGRSALTARAERRLQSEHAFD